MIRRTIRRTLVVLALFILVLVIVAAATPQGRIAVRTALFLPQVLPTIPIKPLEWVTRGPTLQVIEFPIADGVGEADLYIPAGSGKHSAVLFFLGVIPPEDRDDARIVGLAEGLARSGMVVMIPWLDSQDQERIVPEDIDSLVRAFQYLRSLESVDPDKVGIGGICTGASLSTIAAQDEHIRDDVKFVNFFAGYYDALDMVKAIGSRSRFYGDTVAPWKPDSLTRRVFTNHMIDGITDPEDRALLTRIFVDKQGWREEELETLSPEGMVVYRLLNGVSPEEVDGLIQQLSSKTIEFLREISPSTHIDRVKAKILIMHDRGDELVPSEESRRLADALQRTLGPEDDTYHTEFSFFQKEIQVHVDEGKGVGPLGFAKEAFKLFLHMYNILSESS